MNGSAFLMTAALLLATAFGAIAQEAGLFVDDGGNVGIGTSSPSGAKVSPSDPDPAPALHLEGEYAQVFVDQTAAGPGGGRMFWLRNQGGNVQFVLEDQTGIVWSFNNQAGLFVISKLGTGEAEVIVDGQGNITLAGLQEANGGNAQVCVDSVGKLYRGSPGC